jgi:exopolysaccharide biosynthesis protein
VTLAEAARVMRSLGARDALDLDGGGSSAMAVRGKVVNRPSDGVERAVSDALVVMP